MKTGLVLSGGGARGFAHVGVLKVLDEKKIPISAIAGSSMGSIIGAFYASGLSGKKIEKIVKSITWKDFIRIMDLSFSRQGIIKGEKIIEFIKKYMKAETFEELKIPLIINATDLAKKKEVVFRKGNLFRAIRASISVPGLMIPEKINNKLLMDGGLINPLALGLFKKQDIDSCIIVNVGTGLGGKIDLEKPNIVDILKQSINIMQDELIELKLKTVKNHYVLIRPKIDHIKLFDIKDIEKMILKGENSTYKKLPEIEKLLKN